MYRRNLPHWQKDGASLFITWRLAGSLPNRQHSGSAGRDFVANDRELDRATQGPRWMGDATNAECIARVIEETETPLHAFVVMPNHVRVLITPVDSMSDVTRRIKGVSARRANALLGRTGQPFWQDESFDHWVRNRAEFAKIRDYIHQNPVSAGLVLMTEDWPYSSTAPGRKRQPAAWEEVNPQTTG